tara:strand:- start:191 stop:364 length:174 start_codon:yes stop_codon:yes gene_type:complete
MALTTDEINKINELYTQVDVLTAENKALQSALDKVSDKLDTILAAVTDNCGSTKKSR